MRILIALGVAVSVGSLIAGPATAQTSPAQPVRGMEFRTFVQLQKGMTENELMLRAGPADAVGRGEHGITYYYYPTQTDPFMTAVTVSQGRVINIERDPVFENQHW